jgi:hypothetical protein
MLTKFPSRDPVPLNKKREERKEDSWKQFKETESLNGSLLQALCIRGSKKYKFLFQFSAAALKHLAHFLCCEG